MAKSRGRGKKDEMLGAAPLRPADGAMVRAQGAPAPMTPTTMDPAGIVAGLKKQGWTVSNSMAQQMSVAMETYSRQGGNPRIDAVHRPSRTLGSGALGLPGVRQGWRLNAKQKPK